MRFRKAKSTKLKKIGGILLSVMMLMQFITPMKIAKAEDISNLHFIKGVTITDYDGKPLGNNIPKNSNVKVTCDFEVPNNAVIKAGDIYKIKIPEQIYAMGTNFSLDLKTPDGGSVGTFKLGENGSGIITFTDYASTHSNVSGQFSFKTKFNQEKIKNEEKTKLEFNIGWKTETIEVEFRKDEEKVVEPTIKKSASFVDSAKNEVEWTIDVDCGTKTLKDVSVVDTIGEGQEFIPDSIKINGKSAEAKDYKIDGNKLTYTFPGEIAGTRQIKLRTKLKDSFLNSNVNLVDNKAELVVDKKVIDTASANKWIDKSWIKKTAQYDAENNIITWRINLYNNGKTINDAVVEDVIPDKTEYVEGSLKVSSPAMKPEFQKDSSGRTKLVLKGVLDRNVTIVFSTKVTDVDVLKNQNPTNIKNVATIVGTGIPNDTKAEADVNVNGNLINKHSAGYDYLKNEITWKIDVNKSKLHLTGVKITDEIPVGQEYIKDSFKIEGDNSVLGDFNYTPAEKGDTAKTGILVYDFGNKAIDKTYTITFKTKLTDFNPSQYWQGKTVNNTAKLNADSLSELESTGKQDINLKIIEKKGYYTKGQDTIKWDILVNKNKIDLKEGVIKDQLAKGLELDTATIKLNKMNLTNGYWGEPTEGEEVKITKDNFSYNKETGEFIFYIHDMGADVYRLQFETIITDSSLSTVSNTANFEGNGETITTKTTTEVKDIFFIEGEASGRGEVGNIRVNKVDSENGNKPLKGAKFKIYDKFGDLIGNEVSTDENGIVEFSRLRFDVPYTIEETQAPEGYVLSSDAEENRKTFTIDGKEKALLLNINGNVIKSSASKENTWDMSWNNTGAKGNVDLVKVDKKDNRLTGAKFNVYRDINGDGLYDTNDSFVGEMIENSKNIGTYELNDLPYGKYLLKEVEAPKGFVVDAKYYPFNIAENGKTVTVETETGKNFVNNKIKGNVDLLKVDESGNKLTGAEFKVYKDANSNGKFDEDVDSFEGNMIANSNNNSLYELNDLEYGDYLLKEVTAPEGFALDENYHAFQIVEEGKTVTVETEKDKNFVNHKSIGSVELTKVDADYPDNKLTGATFEVYKDVDNNGQFTEGTDKLVGNMTDDQGVYTMANLPYGKYLVKEVKAPEGYVLDTNYHAFQIAENGQKVNVETEAGKNFINNKIKGNVDLLKVDESGNKLTGAEFKVYNDVNKDGKYEEDIDTFLADMTQNKDDSSIYELSNLAYGKYLVKETKAPEGYVLDEDYHAFEITENGKTVRVESNAGKNFVNSIIKGNVELTKVDAEYPDNKLSGATFEVYKDVDNDGEFNKEVDELLGSMIDNDGVYSMDTLTYGKYLVKETKAPEGYVLDEDYHAFEITENGETVNVETEAGKNFINNKIKGNVDLLKVDESGNKLTGAKFEVYKDTNNNGVYDKDVDTLQGNMIENSEDDSLYELNDLDYGKYLVKEIEAPEGYVLDENYHPFEITENGKTVTVETEAGKNFVNYQSVGSVELTKVDADYPDNKLTGASFEVYRDVDNNGEFNKDVDKLVGNMVDNQGVYSMETLPYGNYFVKEVSAPQGYVSDTSYHAFQITEDGQKVNVETEAGKNFVNTKIKGNVNLVKVDEEGNKLTGAEFEVYKDVNKNGVYDEDVDTLQGNMVENSEDNSIYELNDLAYGKYLVKETTAPEGYLLDESYHAFEIAKNGETVNVETEAGRNFVNTKIKGNVNLSKVDEDGNKLIGAKFEVYKDNNNNGVYDKDVDTFKANMAENSEDNSLYELNDLAYGKYLVKEVAAPEGYVLDNDYHAFQIVNNGETVNVETEAGKNFINNKIKGNVDLLKVDESGNKLTGAEFEVYKDVNNNGVYDADVDTLQGNMVENSEDNSLYELNDLAYGKYLVKETTAPEGYVLDTNYHAFEIAKNGETVTVETEAGKNFVNYQSAGSVELTKVDADYPENKLTGATFEVYRDVDNNGEFNKDVDKLVGNMTDDQGVYTINNLPYGKYLVKETKAPEGYVLDADYHAFQIVNNGETVNVETEAGKNFINNKIKGNVNLLKVDESGNKLTGAEFEVYNDVNNNGIYDEDVDTLQGNMIENGSVYGLNDLSYGKYLVKETAAPEGYVLDENYHAFEIANNGETVTVETEAGKNFVNTKIKGNVTLLKVDENENELTGAKFEVYNDVNNNGVYDKDVDTLRGNMLENSKDNSLYELNDLAYGKYFVKEAAAPEGYVLDNNYYAFEITKNGETVNVETKAGKNFVNTKIKGNVDLLKVDENGNKLTGAEFEVYKDVNNNGLYDADVDTLQGNMVGNDSLYELNDLSYGKYLVKETVAPEGYVLDENYHPFEITKNGETVTVETEAGKNFVNYQSVGSVELTKVDADYPDNKLTGATFEVYRDVDNNGEFNKDVDKSLGNMVGNQGVYSMNNLPYGKYLVKETVAPEGYVLDDDYHAFEITDNGQKVNVETEAGKNFINTKIKGNVDLLKVDENGNKLTGAEFEVYKDVNEDGKYDADDVLQGNMVENKDNNSLYELNDLSYGKYLVKEIVAPEGYVLDENYHPFEITKNGETVTVETEAGKNFVNYQSVGSVELTKVDADYPDNKLTGAAFEVYRDVDNNGEFNKDVDKLVGNMVDNQGVYSMETLPVGKYFVKEVSAPEGYVLDTNYHAFQIAENGQKVNVETEAGKNFINTKIKGNVDLLKVDENGNKLTGAKFEVYKDVNEDGKYDAGDVLQGNMVENKDNNSLYQLNNLSYGKYLVKETVAPEGYVLDDDYHAFEITENGKTVTVETEAGKNFVNQAIKGAIQLTKVEKGNVSRQLPGATFVVYRDSDNNGEYNEGVDLLVGNMIDNEGIYTMSNLSYGNYVIKETKAPEGYDLNSEVVAFSITDNNDVISVKFEDSKKPKAPEVLGKVQVMKVDEDGNRLSGAEFKVYKDTDNDGVFDEGIDTLQGNMIENNSEYSNYELDNLSLGKYLLKETKAPEGYVLDAKYHAFEITNSEAVNVETEAGKNFINTKIKGNVDLLKVDENGNKLTGAKFEVYKDVNEDGKYDAGDVLQGNMVENKDNNSLYELNDLSYGKYLVKETVAPEGYVLDENYHAFEIVNSGETVTVETEKGKNFVNYQAVGSVELTKVDADYPDNKLTGAKFEVYRDVDNNGEFDKDVDTVFKEMVDNNGVYSLNTLPIGKYFVKEITAPEGYVLDTNYHAFEIARNGERVNVLSNSDKYFANTKIKGNVNLFKVDENGNGLTGAKFEVYSDANKDGKYDAGDVFQGNMVENNNVTSLYELNDLSYGEYLLKETVAPEGYVLDEEYHAFEIANNGETVTVETQAGKNFVNNVIKGNVELTKVDASNLDKKLPGATFVVYRDADNNGEYTEGVDQKINRDMIDNQGVYSMNDLPYGKYIIREEKAPEGYEINPEIVAFSITETNELVAVQFKDSKKPEAPQVLGNVELTKVDASNLDKKLPGATFVVYRDVDENEKYTEGIDQKVNNMIDNQGVYSMNDLPYGKYIIREEKAPEGYDINPEIVSFSISANNELVAVKFKDSIKPNTPGQPTNPSNPQQIRNVQSSYRPTTVYRNTSSISAKTGDKNRIALIVVVMAVAAGVVIYEIKRRKKIS